MGAGSDHDILLAGRFDLPQQSVESVPSLRLNDTVAVCDFAPHAGGKVRCALRQGEQGSLRRMCSKS